MSTIATDVDDTPARMRRMIETQRQHPGYAMDRYFYRSHVSFARELDSILFRSWLYAGHISQIPEPGDYFQFEVGEDSIIISRNRDGTLHALANSCRHRGARVCEPASGNAKSFVCPYHGWTYGNDGSLRGARHMDQVEGFDAANYGLRKLRLLERHGLIFINADENAADFAASLNRIDHALAPYRLDTARIAHQQRYRIDANWKFVLENYVECYHCATAHRAYARLHSIKDTPANVAHMQDELHRRSAELSGVPELARAVDFAYDKASAFGCDVFCKRYALFTGCVSGSREGKPLAPLMGDFRGYDGGAGDFQIGPLCFMLNYPDHCVLYRFTPRSLTETDADIVWFVHGDAVEGRDYQREELCWLWHNTMLEDDYIIRRNSAGANSRFYQPGPYHPQMEYISVRVVSWYLDRLAASG